jgi:uncharacterized membrane protein YgdD (TMEM256/DUF423 family)
MLSKKDLLVIGIFGFLAVSIGAFGSHALKPTLIENNKLSAFETGVQYHFVHLLAYSFVSMLTIKGVKLTKIAWIVGIVLFSFSLYFYSTLSIKSLAMITPVGGLFFLLGWGNLLWLGLRKGS